MTEQPEHTATGTPVLTGFYGRVGHEKVAEPAVASTP